MDTEALKRSLLKKFQEVTADRLTKIQLGAIDLEKPTAKQAADEVARELHTMKGEARMLGLAAVGQIAHAAEDVLKASREGRTQTSAATDLLLRACDAVSDLLEDLAAAQTGSEISEQICKALSDASGQPIPPLTPGGAAGALKRSASGSTETAKPGGSGGSKVPDPGPRPQPSPPHPEPGPKPPELIAAAGRETPPSEEAVAHRTAATDRSIRVAVETLDTIGLVAGDLLVESAKARLRTGELNAILARFSRLGDRVLKLADTFRSGALDEHSVDLLSSDLDMLRDDAFRFTRRHGDGMNTLHGSLAVLADHVAAARLVPLATVFEAFPRAVRDMARTQKKEVDLQVQNSGAGVDRSMLADVRDALVHLLRNSVDHGIEDPGFREALGKPRVGRLTIRVRADGDMLHMDVEDDGRGIDPERLRASAIARKVLTAQQAAALTEREAIELVFINGFSTREEVSELSGRGVGMDVVKRKVEALGGSVSVSSRVGRGTVISLRLPQSLALMRVLLFRLGDDVYGVPAADVEAVVRIKPEDRLEVFGTLAVKHRGSPVALVGLGPLLALNGGNRYDRPPSVIVHHGQDRAALVVDGFVGEREVAVKPCGGEFLKGAGFVAGTAALEDGRIAVLLHVPDIMQEVRRMARPVQSSQATTTKRLKVLLVDDSPIARATESALVKALGHQVEEAQDGEEALQKMQGQAFDLILTDVQMPKIDGFALTRRLKGTSATSRLPVIILSSLASPEDKRRGMDAGADAYLVKGELGVESLAQAIDRLT